MGEGDASGGKSDYGQENEQSSDDGGWFHFDGDVPFMRLRARCGVRCVSYCKSMPCSGMCEMGVWFGKLAAFCGIAGGYFAESIGLGTPNGSQIGLRLKF